MKKIVLCFPLLLAFVFLTPMILVETGFERISLIYAQTKDQCGEQLDKAEEEYQAGKWTEVIDLIEQCLKKENVGELEKGRAYRILGLVYIAIQLEKEANDAVKNLLIMVPNYKVDPDKDPPSLKKIIDKMAESLNPKITSITPNSAVKDDKEITMKINGSNFVYGSVVKFNGIERSTTFISDTELKTELLASDLLKEGEYGITVHSPIMGGKTSNTEKFVVNASSSFPWTWIAVGGGAVAAVVAAIFLTKPSPENDNEILPDPPIRP